MYGFFIKHPHVLPVITAGLVASAAWRMYRYGYAFGFAKGIDELAKNASESLGG